MAKLRTIKTDSAAERDGVWMKYPGTDIEIKIARFGNPSFEADSREFRTLAKQAKDGVELTERESKDAVAPAVARHLVKDWRNLEDDDGAAIPFSQERAVELLKTPELHDLYDWIVAQSRNADRFRRAEVAATVGNS